MADDDLERLRARAEAFDGDGESDSDDMYEDAPEQYSKQNAVNDSEEESQEESDLDSSSEEDSEDDNAAAASSRSAPDRAMRALLSLATASHLPMTLFQLLQIMCRKDEIHLLLKHLEVELKMIDEMNLASGRSRYLCFSVRRIFHR